MRQKTSIDIGMGQSGFGSDVNLAVRFTSCSEKQDIEEARGVNIALVLLEYLWVFQLK